MKQMYSTKELKNYYEENKSNDYRYEESDGIASVNDWQGNLKAFCVTDTQALYERLDRMDKVTRHLYHDYVDIAKECLIDDTLDYLLMIESNHLNPLPLNVMECHANDYVMSHDFVGKDADRIINQAMGLYQAMDDNNECL